VCGVRSSSCGPVLHGGVQGRSCCGAVHARCHNCMHSKVPCGYLMINCVFARGDRGTRSKHHCCHIVFLTRKVHCSCCYWVVCGTMLDNCNQSAREGVCNCGCHCALVWRRKCICVVAFAGSMVGVGVVAPLLRVCALGYVMLKSLLLEARISCANWSSCVPCCAS
jgi:hypothetical protein